MISKLYTTSLMHMAFQNTPEVRCTLQKVILDSYTGRATLRYTGRSGEAAQCY